MITVRDEGPLRVVTLDRPDARNALTPAGLDALAEAVTDAPASVVYLHGAGGAFSAGADLGEVARIAEEGGVDAFIERGQATATAIESADAVVVAGIDGPARGGGVELALACDLRVATPDATFGEPGVTFGLFGAWGGTVRLPEVVGMGDALDLSLSGRVIDAAEAHRIGLVSRVVEEPRAVAEELARNDPSALAAIKHRVRDRASRSEQEDREKRAFETLVAEHADALADYRKD
ncbi:enoyl-CoA hydratase/isomerase family protein [Natronomonas sp. EA1]|uniref:enoyl-CoA hydratase/isomerase family protein n=1 Tax=Natronomonas sp. EA1 TaxID=3421655 RepID=UPI003EB986F5